MQLQDMNKPENKHTPITDEILAVIDQQPLNRYAVALRLTRWYEKKQVGQSDTERKTP